MTTKPGNGSGQGQKSIAIYYEHPDWYKPLFVQLEARNVRWQKIHAGEHLYGIHDKAPEYSLFFNRMSPSAWQRDLAHAIFYTQKLLRHLESIGVRVVNGSRAFAHETSKALQLQMLEGLGLPYPKAVVIHHPSQALVAAEAVGYPLIIKPNIGGSGAGIKRFSTPGELRSAVAEKELDFGIDCTALVQECFVPRDSVVTRVEVLGGKYLYAIQIHLSGDGFNLCPADICQNTRGEELTRVACAVDAPKSGLQVEGYEPPKLVVEQVERIMQTAGIEVGGIEYVTDDCSGRLLYYDINALSNFVADPVRVVGFDPYARLADFLIAEAEIENEASGETAQTAFSGVGQS
jgi:Carbamoyl-phosphate synthase L chain, ATP binding domain